VATGSNGWIRRYTDRRLLRQAELLESLNTSRECDRVSLHTAAEDKCKEPSDTVS